MFGHDGPQFYEPRSVSRIDGLAHVVTGSSSTVIRFDRFKLDTQRRVRAEDGALIVPGRLARIGTQEYDQGDGTVQIEYRPPEEVFSDEAIASFDGLVVTDLHPETEMINSGSFREHTRGHIQNPRRAGDWLVGDCYIHDSELQREINSGERDELSGGYFARLDHTPGTDPSGTNYHTIQRRIRGNHVAVLPPGTARAGPEARLIDSKGNELPSWEREKYRMEFTIMIGGVPYTLKGDAASKAVLEQLVTEHSSVVAERDREQARADTAEDEVKEIKVRLVEATDPARLDAAAKVRATLIEKARRIGGVKLDCTGTDREIRLRALDVIGVKDLVGRSDDYVEARFDAKADGAPEGSPSSTLVDAMAGISRQRATASAASKRRSSTLRDARNDYLNRMRGEV